MSPRHGDRVPPPRREREHHPSFSAALLDAIYHSLDGDADAELRRANVSPEEMPPPPPACRHRRSTASSPSASSARSSPRSQRPPRPCRVRPHPQPPSLLLPPPQPLLPGDDMGVEAKRTTRRKKRRARSAPFACLLNALLCNRKPPASSASIDEQRTPTRAPLPPVKAEPASARSILSSRASRRESAASAPGGFLHTPGRRAVRFSPAVEVVGDGEHGCGARTAIRLREVGGSGAEVAAAPRASAAEAERRVEELLRALGAAEERERAKESSESSSDLFELDSMPPTFDDTQLPRTRAAGGLAPPRPRVLVDDMVV